MPKRVGFIYEKIVDKKNIESAIMMAARGKRDRRDVQRVLSNIDYYVDEIHNMLIRETYEPSPYTIAVIKEGIKKKERTIYKPRFYPDQVVHWAIYLQLYPVLVHGMYDITAGSIRGRGVHYGKKFVERWVKNDHKNTKYYAKLDITKFYPSIKIRKLIAKLRRRIKDEKVISLIILILSLTDELPIGVLLSQLFAIYMLQDLDHYIKKMGAVYYIRYMDDMIIFGPNKKKLHKLITLISDKIAEDNLKIKDNYQVCLFIADILDFMGYRFYRYKTILRKDIMYRATRNARKIGKSNAITARDASAMISRMGWVKSSDSNNLYKHEIEPYVNIGYLKNIIRQESKADDSAKKRKYSNPYRNRRYIESGHRLHQQKYRAS